MVQASENHTPPGGWNPRLSKCRGETCGADVVWFRSANGKPVILNPEVFHVDVTGDGARRTVWLACGLLVRMVENPESLLVGREQHHYTCPDRDSFNKS